MKSITIVSHTIETGRPGDLRHSFHQNLRAASVGSCHVLALVSQSFEVR